MLTKEEMAIKLANRNRSADVVKGFAIATIVLFHSSLVTVFYDYISPLGLVFMPLFFFLSGAFLNIDHTLKHFLLKKSDILMKPFFVVLLIYFCITTVFPIPALPEASIGGILYGTGNSIPWIWIPMWYLPATWSTLIFSFFILKYTPFREQHWSVQIIVLVLWLLAGSMLIGVYFWKEYYTIFDTRYFVQGLPFSSDLFVLTGPFFLAGYFLRVQVKNFSPSIIIATVCMGIYFSIILFTEVKLDFNKRILINPLLALPAIISGAYLAFCVAHYIAKVTWLSNIIIEVGRASLFILIFHLLIHAGGRMLMSNYFPEYYIPVVYSAVIYPISIVIPVYLKKLCQKNKITTYLLLPIVK